MLLNFGRRISLVLIMLLTWGSVATQASGQPTLRGSDSKLEMLIHGRVFGDDAQPENGAKISAMIWSAVTQKSLPVTTKENSFEFWLPVKEADYYLVKINAESADGKERESLWLQKRELRSASTDGIEIKLQSKSLDRTVAFTVQHQGKAVPDAYLGVSTGVLRLDAKTDEQGQAFFQLPPDQRVAYATAWTDDFLIGGFSVFRKPRRDPLAADYTIEMVTCRDQEIQFLTEREHKPVVDVPFYLTLGAGEPHYNFYGTRSSFPHGALKTNKDGIAVCRWFPDLSSHGAYADIDTDDWIPVGDSYDWVPNDDGRLLKYLRKSVRRKPLKGRVVADAEIDVSGLLIQVMTFEAEEEGKFEQLAVFTDKEGKFEVDCLPGATYSVCVNDEQLVSDFAHVMPYDPKLDQSNEVTLKVEQGVPVIIKLTQGTGYEPVPNQWVGVYERQSFSWQEDGETQSGSGSLSRGVATDESGIAATTARAGAEIDVSVSIGDWTAERRTYLVKPEGLTEIEVHREVADPRLISGVLRQSDGQQFSVANAEIILNSDDDENDETLSATTDNEGRFELQSRSSEFHIFAYTADGKAAGLVRSDGSEIPVEVTLNATASIQGLVLGEGDQPVAHRIIRTRNVFGKGFHTMTDNDGTFLLPDLPAGVPLSVELVDEKRKQTLDEFFLEPGEATELQTYSIAAPRSRKTVALSSLYSSTLRDARLGDYHMLVISAASDSSSFVRRFVTNYDRLPAVATYMNLSVPMDLSQESANFCQDQDWPKATAGVVFLCALDSQGDELGRIEVQTEDQKAPRQVADFIEAHAPDVNVAKKWDAAFAEARRTNRKVWVRISGRYCGPCFLLSRWLDDHREVIQKDYVLLKVSERDVELTRRLLGDRLTGIPFHGIFDADGQLLVDSEGPAGNAGCAFSFAGRRHFRQMLMQTRSNLTEQEIENLIDSLKR